MEGGKSYNLIYKANGEIEVRSGLGRALSNLGEMEEAEAQIRQAEARVAELKADYQAQFVNDRASAGIVREQLQSEKASLAFRFADH